MPHTALLLHGVDPLFLDEGRQALGPTWAKRRFARLVWAGLWKAVLAAVFSTTGLVLVARIDWSQTAVLLVPGVFLIGLGLRNVLLAGDRLCGAVAGYAVLAFLSSKPLRAAFQGWAAHVGAALGGGTKGVEQIHPYGLTRGEHTEACWHLGLFQTNAALVVQIHAGHQEQDLAFPQVVEPSYGHLFVDPGLLDRSFLWAYFPKVAFAFPNDAHPHLFAFLRWVAAKAGLQSLHIGLPLTGNPQGSAHARMAFFNSLHATA
jgi:hypothetical protein